MRACALDSLGRLQREYGEGVARNADERGGTGGVDEADEDESGHGSQNGRGQQEQLEHRRVDQERDRQEHAQRQQKPQEQQQGQPRVRHSRLRPPTATARTRPAWRGGGVAPRGGGRGEAEEDAAARARRVAQRDRLAAAARVGPRTEAALAPLSAEELAAGWEEEVRGLFARVAQKSDDDSKSGKSAHTGGERKQRGRRNSAQGIGEDASAAVALEEEELARRAAELDAEMARLHEARVRIHLRNEEGALRRRAADSLNAFEEELTSELEERLRDVAEERQAKVSAERQAIVRVTRQRLENVR